MSSGRIILIIDDDIGIRRFLRVTLDAEGYKTVEATKVSEGLSFAAQHRPEITLLDLSLPDNNGLEFLKSYREWSTNPVIVITALESEEHKVTLLDAGADDYLTKPFGAPELLARIRVALRHMDKNQSEQPVYKHPAFEIDFTARKVTTNGKIVKLTVTEFQLLKLLAQNEGKVLTQSHILQTIWGPNALNDSHYLRIYISHLRKKLEINTTETPYILTEPGIGYKLNR